MDLRSGASYPSPHTSCLSKENSDENYNTPRRRKTQKFNPDSVILDLELKKKYIQELEEKLLAQATPTKIVFDSSKERQYMELIDQLKMENAGYQKMVETMLDSNNVQAKRIRCLRDEVQELKGNIRVYCRIRPCIKGEIPFEGLKITDKPRGGSLLELKIPEMSSTNQVRFKEYSFNLDYVYGTQSTQEDVYNELSELIPNVTEGKRVSIFAYGQTGSGKSFTIQGDRQNQGVIFRAIEQIFDEGLDAKYEVTIMELYNENIRDLLNSDTKSKQDYNIRHLEDGSTVVSNLVVRSVHSCKDVFELLDESFKNRATATTQKNDQSSRSHYIFTLRVNVVCDGKLVQGVLNLIDLAGSERFDKDGSPDRMSETKYINSSLSSLGDVIHASASGEKHVPFRNSKLTYYLQNSLSGKGSKTLMFVNVSSSTDAMTETLNSLRFAGKVNSVKMKL